MNEDDKYSRTVKFYYHIERKTMTIDIGGLATVLGPFGNEAEAALAAHEFCVARSMLSPKKVRHPRSVH